MKKEKLFTAKELAEKLQVNEDYIVTLCENNIIQALHSNNVWLIGENTQLPCIKYLDLSKNIDPVELNILNNNYQTIDLIELTSWNTSIYYDDEAFGIEQIIISKGLFKDTFGKQHIKYVLSFKSYASVAEWDDSLEHILYYVKESFSQSSDVKFIGIFDNLDLAYKYASVIYSEIPLVEYIINRREIILAERDELDYIN